MKSLIVTLGLASAALIASATYGGEDVRVIETWGYSAKDPAEGVARGRQVYVQWCAICHEGGPGMAGTQGLMRKYRGELPALLRERTDLSAEYVEYIVRNGVASMPFFRKTEVSDADLEVLTGYLLRAAGSE